MRFVLTILASVVFFSSAFADINSTGSAIQTVQLTLAPAIQISAAVNNISVNTNGSTYSVKSNSNFTITAGTEVPGKDVTTNQKKLTTGNATSEQVFAMNYKAAFNGRVIYTATQP